MLLGLEGERRGSTRWMVEIEGECIFLKCVFMGGYDYVEERVGLMVRIKVRSWGEGGCEVACLYWLEGERRGLRR